MALYELFTRPHYWQKTTHGLHLTSTETANNTDPEWEELARIAESLTPVPNGMGPTLLHSPMIAALVQKYTKLAQVPVASVQDNIATVTMTCYYLLAWTQSNALAYLLATAGCSSLAMLSSYNAWIFLLVLPVVIFVITLLKHHTRKQIVSDLLVFSMLSYLGAVSWIAWHQAIFGDTITVLHMLFLPAAPPSVLAAAPSSTYHNVWQSLSNYGLTALATLGPAMVLLALLAIIVLLVRQWFKPTMFATFALLLPLASGSLAIYSGYILLFSPLFTIMDIPFYLLAASSGAELVAPCAIFVAILLTEAWSALQLRRPNRHLIVDKPTI